MSLLISQTPQYLIHWELRSLSFQQIHVIKCRYMWGKFLIEDNHFWHCTHVVTPCCFFHQYPRLFADFVVVYSWPSCQYCLSRCTRTLLRPHFFAWRFSQYDRLLFFIFQQSYYCWKTKRNWERMRNLREISSTFRSFPQNGFKERTERGKRLIRLSLTFLTDMIPIINLSTSLCLLEWIFGPCVCNSMLHVGLPYWDQSADNYRTINRDEHFRFIKHDMCWFPSVITIFITASFSSQIIMCVHACWIAACWGGRNRWKRSASSLWLNHGRDGWIFFHCHSWYCVTEFLPAWTSITRYSKIFKITSHAAKVEGNHSVSVLLCLDDSFYSRVHEIGTNVFSSGIDNESIKCPET